MSVLLALAEVAAAASQQLLPGDRLAVAAAVEVLDGRHPSSLTPHKDAVIFWSDAGSNLVQQLNKQSEDRTPIRDCEAHGVEVAPAREIQMQFMPKEFEVADLRQLKMTITCEGTRSWPARVTYHGNVLVGVQYIVESD